MGLSGRQLAGSGNRNTRQDGDVRKTNGIRFNGINQQDLRKKLGCQQEWNKPGRLGTTPGAEITLQDVKFKRKKKKKKKKKRKLKKTNSKINRDKQKESSNPHKKKIK